jgi:hypothetical protein
MGSRAISMKNVRAFKVVTSCPLWATVNTNPKCCLETSLSFQIEYGTIITKDQ